MNDFDIVDIVSFGRLLERHYGQPVQIEFSTDYDVDKRRTCFQFLQARPLPAKMFEAPKVEFPTDLQPIYECSAEGVCDEVLDLLGVYENNNNKKGFVVYRTSWEGSNKRASLESAMPKEGAVMILSATEPGRGHIETLALERGVTLLFHNRKDLFYDNPDPIIAGTRNSISKCFERRSLGLSGDFAGHKKVRIVANGKIARIYPVLEEAT